MTARGLARARSARAAGGGDGRSREREREREPERGREATVAVGLLVGFCALGMTFAALLLAYGIVRIRAGGVWPPQGEPRLPHALWPLPLLATLAAVATSGMMLAASRAGHRPRGDRRRLLAALGGSTLCGLLFLLVQVIGAMKLLALGVRPSAGIGMSVVFALTAFHALHALAATLAVAILGAHLLRGARERRATLAAVAAFVHLVTALWLVVCVAVFVL